MKVLVHYDSQGLTAHGLWWVGGDGNPQALYHDMNSAEKARGTLIVFSKSNPEVSWERWFDTLTGRAPYFETWLTYDSMGFSPEQMLNALDPSPLVS